MTITSPNEQEISVQNALALEVQRLNRRVQHLETLERPAPVLDIDLTDVTIANTTAETSFYSLTIPGNILNDSNGVRLTLVGRIKQDAAAARTLTTRVTYGSTTILTDAQAVNNGLAFLSPWLMHVFLLADGATDAQEMSLFNVFSLGRPVETVAATFGSAAEDSTDDLTLEFTVEWSAAEAGLIFEYRQAIVEILSA